MPYVMRNPQGDIVALYKHAEAGSEYLSSDAPEVLAFFSDTAKGEGFSLQDDLAMIRVIEDVIELLIAKNLIVLTDLFCDWAPRFTPHVLAVPTQTGMFWSSPVALVCAVNLMVNSVIRQIGTKVETRLEKLTRLHQTFTGYAGHQPPRPKMST